jgi:long-chain acyl-CoA synthetase
LIYERVARRALLYDTQVNVVDLFFHHDPDSVAFICDGESQTYGQLASRVSTGRAELATLAKAGSNIVVMGESSLLFIETLFAALSAGLAVVPLHPRYPKGEVERAVQLARPVLIISTDEASRTLVEGLGIDYLPADALFSDTSSAPIAPLELEPEHPALLMFTSGTAGSPRIAVLSHGNVAASIEQTRGSAPGLADQSHVILGVMPLTHVLGIVSVVAVAISVGATVVLATKVDVDSIADAVMQNQVTFLVAPPVFWFRLANSEVDPAMLASVTMTLSGAAPLTGAVADKMADRFGLKLRQGYGLTEASPGLTSAVGTEAPATSVGRPMPGVKLRLVDEHGDDVLIGDVGELWAQGPNVFSGYLGDPEATATVIDGDGWLHTGDLAVVDENGFLYIVGRNKDQIIVSGFNVHPGEVEDCLMEHHSVEAAAVIGNPDPEYGEVVVAYVVPARGMEADPDVLEAHCRTRLVGYKVPSRFEIVDELPRGATGKLQRRILRQ